VPDGRESALAADTSDLFLRLRAKTGVIELSRMTLEVTHHVGQGCRQAASAGQIDTY